MPVKVEWVDLNTAADSYRLYRQDTPILDNALPVPLATIAKGTKFYQDDTALRNQVYHYRVGVVVGADETLSVNTPIANMPYTGPGPQTLLRGTWECGYFGRVAVEDVFSPAELRSLVLPGLGGGVDTATNWGKFVYKGKILFFPDAVMMTSQNWRAFYMAGLVYGNEPQANWPSYVKTTYGVVPQGVTVQRGDHQFVVRMPLTRLSPAVLDTAAPGLYAGEVDQLLGLAYIGRSLFNNQPSIPSNVGNFDDNLNAGQYFMCADSWNNNSTYIARGFSSFDQLSQTDYATANTTTGWRPVLELIL